MGCYDLWNEINNRREPRALNHKIGIGICRTNFSIGLTVCLSFRQSLFLLTNPFRSDFLLVFFSCLFFNVSVCQFFCQSLIHSLFLSTSLGCLSTVCAQCWLTFLMRISILTLVDKNNHSLIQFLQQISSRLEITGACIVERLMKAGERYLDHRLIKG